MTTTLVRSATAADFDRTVLASPTPVLVDFWAEWCPPCHALSPILEAIAAEHEGELTIVKVNADDNIELAARFQAFALPTMKLIVGGEVVKTIVGAKRRGTLEEELSPFLAQTAR